MHTIGILGGMGSYATIDLFQRIVDFFPAEKEWDRPRIIIDNNCTMPSRVRAILYGEKKEQLIQEMSKSINGLVDCGATKILIGCITAHCFLEYLPHQELIVNMVRETAKSFSEEEVMVLCTEGTKDVGLWERNLIGSKVRYPEGKQMLQLREFIEAVKQGKVTYEIKDKFLAYIDDFEQKNILLGCTELPVLMKERQISKKRIIDPIECMIEAMRKEIII